MDATGNGAQDTRHLKLSSARTERPNPRAKERVRVVVADDDAMILNEIVRLLDTRFDVVGRTGNGRELLGLVDALSPKVVVADVTMPGLNGIQAARQITTRHPDIKVIMLSGYTDETLIAGAHAAGASGYVAKLQTFTHLIPAIDAALTPQSEETWHPPVKLGRAK
jgi:DNA-binding NarL/FixJ family response regulator